MKIRLNCAINLKSYLFFMSHFNELCQNCGNQQCTILTFKNKKNVINKQINKCMLEKITNKTKPEAAY